MKFRKKPVVIEAIQFTGSFSFDEMTVEWGEKFPGRYNHTSREIFIRTLEGTMTASIGDWIIKDIREMENGTQTLP